MTSECDSISTQRHRCMTKGNWGFTSDPPVRGAGSRPLPDSTTIVKCYARLIVVEIALGPSSITLLGELANFSIRSSQLVVSQVSQHCNLGCYLKQGPTVRLNSGVRPGRGFARIAAIAYSKATKLMPGLFLPKARLSVLCHLPRLAFKA